MEHFYNVLIENGIASQLKILFYDSDEYPGYSYIKIYNKNVTREHMAYYLKEMLGATELYTFGSIENKYDYVVKPGDSNEVVLEMKKRYETIKKKFIRA